MLPHLRSQRGMWMNFRFLRPDVSLESKVENLKEIFKVQQVVTAGICCEDMLCPRLLPDQIVALILMLSVPTCRSSGAYLFVSIQHAAGFGAAFVHHSDSCRD